MTQRFYVPDNTIGGVPVPCSPMDHCYARGRAWRDILSTRSWSLHCSRGGHERKILRFLASSLITGSLWIVRAMAVFFARRRVHNSSGPCHVSFYHICLARDLARDLVHRDISCTTPSPLEFFLPSTTTVFSFEWLVEKN